jgi:hypothetical protein
MPPWSLCGWQGIWWQLDVCTNRTWLPLMIVYMLLVCHPFLVFSLQTWLCLGCDWIFWFAPCTPHHNHLDCLHLTMGAHFLCLKFITHHDFQFGLKGFKHLFPSMVQASHFSWINSSRNFHTMKFSQQARHLCGLVHLVLIFFLNTSNHCNKSV